MPTLITTQPLTIVARLRAMTTAIMVPQLARLLLYSPNTLYDRVKAGRIPGVLHIPGSIRLDPKIIADWLEFGPSLAA